jgi:phosphoenolpyruvate phosphomutase / 2-hydroxyethylphosphonate cytidylyltransferase
MEVHSGLTGLIVEHVEAKRDGKICSFDGFWGSSLTASTNIGRPDIESVGMDSRLAAINDILEVTTKPLIFDADTGGRPEHLSFHVRTMERMGISAMIIEDKVGLKKNSLLGTDAQQTQASPVEFAEKLRAAKRAQITSDFMVIARIESLILGQGMADALERAATYLEAGADGIMIHSCSKAPDEVLTFCSSYFAAGHTAPLIVVPTSYNAIYEEQLAQAGVKIVIYANHLIRAAYPAMVKTAKSILMHGRSLEADEDCLSIKEILELIPGTI